MAAARPEKAFTSTFEVPAPHELVRAFHEGSDAFRRLAPPLSFARIHRAEPLAEGSITEFTMMAGPLPVRWLARHKDVSPSGFTDVQESGPMASWVHRHTYEPLGEGTTRVRDEVTYRHKPAIRGLVTRLIFNPAGLRALFTLRAFATRRAVGEMVQAQRDASRQRVVVVGGGFGGLAVAQGLNKKPVAVTLLDRTNHHLFQPLLYQVATGALSPANIAAPLRGLLRRQRNVRVVFAEVDEVRVRDRIVSANGLTIPFDYLVLATGARHHYFGHEQWEQYAPGLKTVDDALGIRERVLRAFERAEVETNPDTVAALLTFVVVGAGPTGVELAGALAELARETLPREFRSIDPASARIILVDGEERVLPQYPPSLSKSATEALNRLGVEVRLGSFVTDVSDQSVELRAGPEDHESVAARTVLWAAGVLASPLGRLVAEQVGAQVDPAGRVVVEADLSLRGHPNIFVIGDLAHVERPDGALVPGIAPVAMSEGAFVARAIERRVGGHQPGAFRYKDGGKMAAIGRGAAVADLGRIRLSGPIGWLAWLGVHLLALARFENRLLVFTQWAWSYWTRGRSARILSARPPERP